VPLQHLRAPRLTPGAAARPARPGLGTKDHLVVEERQDRVGTS
jgi:hypothetical protein